MQWQVTKGKEECRVLSVERVTRHPTPDTLYDMKGNETMKSKLIMLIFAALLCIVAHPAFAQNAWWDELVNLPFPENYPTKHSSEVLLDELTFQRGVQVYLWALPAMNMYGTKEGSEMTFGKGYNVLPVFTIRRYLLPSELAGAHSGEQLLVGDRLRRRDGIGARQRAAVPVCQFLRQTSSQPRWVHGHLLRTDRAERLREELDSFRARPYVVCLLPPLCAHGSAFQPDVDTSGL